MAEVSSDRLFARDISDEKEQLRPLEQNVPLIEQIKLGLKRPIDHHFVTLCTTAICQKSLSSKELRNLLKPHADHAVIGIILKALHQRDLIAVQKSHIDLDAFFKAAIIAESHLNEWKTTRRKVVKEEKNYTIEYHPVTQHVFIRFPKSNKTSIGKGVSKSWYKAVAYEQAQIVAHTTITLKNKNKKELVILQKLRNLPGIVETYGISTLPSNKEKHSQIGLMQKFYNGGNLESYALGDKQLSSKQKETIALGILQGLSSIHRAGILHNDLHVGQCLVEFTEEGEVSAKVGDFDKATIITKNTKKTSAEYFFEEELAKGENFEEDKENNGADEINSEVLTRLKLEKSQDKNSLLGYFREDLYQMAVILNQLLLNGEMSLESLDTQKLRHTIEDGLASKKTTFEKLPKKKQIEYVIAKLVAYSDAKAISAEQALALLTKAFT